MTTREPNPTGIPNPQELTIEADSPNFIPLRANFYSPTILNRWRADQFMAALELKLEGVELSHDETLALREGSYEATNLAEQFDPTEGLTKFSQNIQKVARILGAEEFQRIYNMPPTPEIVDYMMSEEYLAGSKYAKPYLAELTIQVLRGRLPWDERFNAAGVPTPEEYVEAEIELAEDNILLWEGNPHQPEWAAGDLRRKLALEALAKTLKSV